MADLDTTNPAPEALPPTTEEGDDPQDREVVADPETPEDQPDASEAEAAARQAAAEDEEEVEIGGKKYTVPKALQKERMLHADYTRKTQEVAAERKAFADWSAAERTRLAEQAKVEEATRQSRAELLTIDKQLSAYTPDAWRLLQQRDAQNGTNETQQHLALHASLRADRDRLAGEVSEAERARELETQREAAKRAEDARTDYARKIETARTELEQSIGWSQQLAQQVETVARKDFGITDEELGIMATDSRFCRLAHYARLGLEWERKQKAPTARRDTPQPEPIRQVGTSRQPATTGPADRDPTETWMKKRNAKDAQDRKRA